jgi:cobalt transporter subunit CbtB
MTTTTRPIARAEAGLGAILVTLFLGAALLFTAGFANSAALHSATHDSRHAIAFPCH